jgi:hypothetical protein
MRLEIGRNQMQPMTPTARQLVFVGSGRYRPTRWLRTRVPGGISKQRFGM